MFTILNPISPASYKTLTSILFIFGSSYVFTMNYDFKNKQKAFIFRLIKNLNPDHSSMRLSLHFLMLTYFEIFLKKKRTDREELPMNVNIPYTDKRAFLS